MLAQMINKNWEQKAVELARLLGAQLLEHSNTSIKRQVRTIRCTDQIIDYARDLVISGAY